jgi:AcrR family transcriptional regulator
MADDERQRAREPLAEARTGVTETGRVNQKLRTRQALIDAASELVAAGANPTLAEVAEHALVSKTTAYRYFASADALITEVFFDREFPTVDEVLGDADDDPTTRVLAVEAAVNDTMLAHERAMRVIVRNAIDMALVADDDGPQRVGRRQKLIAAALQPLEPQVDPQVLQRLRDALALVIGPEAILAARDVCRLDPDETRKLTQWAAEALVARALSESDRPTDRPSRQRRAR